MLPLDKKQQSNFFLTLTIIGGIASAFTIWNHIENNKMRKLQKEVALLTKQKLQKEMAQMA